jgi:signal transduction histidine kinase
MDVRMRWHLAMAAAGLGLVGWLIWAVGHTEPPPWPVILADLIAVLGLAIMPWLVLLGRQLIRAREGERLISRVVLFVAIFALGGPSLGILFLLIFGQGDPTIAFALTVMSMAAAGIIALVGGVLLPGVALLTRTVARERSARVRAEERAEVAAHLHDSVLQALTLIQKRADDSRSVRQLARSTERELRVWLYGAAPSAAGDDLAAAVRAVCEEIEDRFDLAVELVAVGTCPLDEPALAVVGAVREALTNAGKHAGVRQVSAFVEAADGELLALVRDRGRGFDPGLVPADRRGIADSIEARIRQHGGAARVRSSVGTGVEVELRVAR